MTSPTPATSVNAAFFEPLRGLSARSSQARACPEFSDEDYLHCGVQRVLEASVSGRAFLQEHGPSLPCAPKQANYFVTLHSARRLKLLEEVNHLLRAAAQPVLHNRLAGIPELARYDCFAADGHWHKAATHDPRHEDAKMAVGHFAE